jgi:hypothetical protein
MNLSLQTYLIIVGLALIVLLLCFNWWQDFRARRRMQAHLPVIEQDPLLADGSTRPVVRVEPGIGGAAHAYDQAHHNPIEQQHPDAASYQEESDPSVEVVIDMTFQGPIQGQDLVQMVAPMRSAGRKPVRIFAQDTDGQLSTHIRHDTQYVSLQLAVLLANRTGALSAIEWSQIWNRAQSLADQLECTIEGPDQQTVLAAASKLDNVCAALDTQVGLTLLLGASKPVTEVTHVACNMGFIPANGSLSWLGDHGMVCFNLTRADLQSFDAGMAGVDRLSLLLDVPCSPADARAFSRMVEVGVELAKRMGAELVDDQNRPLQPGSEGQIDERLQTIYAQLDALGLTASSPRARRVFS